MPKRKAESLDACVSEFTARVHSYLPLAEDDAHFWQRVSVDIDELTSRCKPGEATELRFRIGSVLAGLGLTPWQVEIAHPRQTRSAMPADRGGKTIRLDTSASAPRAAATPSPSTTVPCMAVVRRDTPRSGGVPR